MASSGDYLRAVVIDGCRYGHIVDPRTGRLILLSAEDNIVKGASGQAVQRMNLLCGFPETAGLI